MKERESLQYVRKLTADVRDLLEKRKAEEETAQKAPLKVEKGRVDIQSLPDLVANDFHQLSDAAKRIAGFCLDKAMETKKERLSRLWVSLALRSIKTVSTLMEQKKVDELEKRLIELEETTKDVENQLRREYINKKVS